MMLQNVLWLVGGAGFLLAAVYSLMNYFLTKRVSNLWLWLSVSMFALGISRFLNAFFVKDALWKDALFGIVVAGLVVLIVVLSDFEKEVSLCVNCGSSTSDLPRKRERERER